MSLPEEANFDYKDFLDRTTILYGASGTGKSFFTQDIMHLLKPHVPQVVVFSPTDPSNHTYSKGLVRKPFIHYQLTEQMLIKIWKRQEAFSAIYSKANNFAILQKLFMRLNIPHVSACLDKVHSCKADNIAKVNEQFAENKQARSKKTAEIEEKFNEFITLMYKHYVNKHSDELHRMNLSPDERFSLKYLHFNPRMLLIFDDCSADFKTIKSKEGKAVLGKMFFQNRWAYMTIIVGLHDDKMMDSELRKNSYINVFTNKATAFSYFNKDSNGISPDVFKKVKGWIANDLWAGNDGCQKLVYNRQKDMFYRYTAKEHSLFTFGGKSIQNYCDKVESTGISIDPNNEFLNLFT